MNHASEVVLMMNSTGDFNWKYRFGVCTAGSCRTSWRTLSFVVNIYTYIICIYIYICIHILYIYIYIWKFDLMKL